MESSLWIGKAFLPSRELRLYILEKQELLAVLMARDVDRVNRITRMNYDLYCTKEWLIEDNEEIINWSYHPQ
jgi:hypothetical protein